MHLLNLDVVAGALVGNLMVRYLLQTPAYSVMSFYVLGSTVFIIYTADRLWDVRRTKIISTDLVRMTPRHRFHYEHQPLLWGLISLLTIVTGWLALSFLPLPVFRFGLELALLVVLYLGFVHLMGSLAHIPSRYLFHKEPLVAILYTAGIWGSVLVIKHPVALVDWVLCLVFGWVAFQNLLLFSLFDMENDLCKNESSLATYWGTALTQRVLNWLFIVIILVSGAVLLVYAQNARQREVASTEALMSITLFILGYFPTYFRQGERYRWLGDGIFFIPLLIVDC
ncbi:MAG: hypothetical protein V4714_05970 [Bacteroidota bacterium]